MNIIFLGPPGAGKGTIAGAIKDKYQLGHLSTGDMLRAEIKAQTELGSLAKGYIDKGQLVPDDVIIGMVENKLKSQDGGLLFDGFPRTVQQADALGEIADIDAVINLDVPLEVVIKRICSRRICPACSKVFNTNTYGETTCDACGAELITRADDNEETVSERYQVYQKNTQPLIQYYDEKGLLTTIDADDSVENICEQISRILESEG